MAIGSNHDRKRTEWNLGLVDNKAVTQWNPVFEAQMLTYLRLTGLNLGLVINFGEQFVKNGIHRVLNGLVEALGRNAKSPRRRDARGGESRGKFSHPGFLPWICLWEEGFLTDHSLVSGPPYPLRLCVSAPPR